MILKYSGAIALFFFFSCTDPDKMPTGPSSTFPTSVDGLPQAVSADTITINNGDTVTLTSSFAAKTIRTLPIRMMTYNGSVPGPFIKVKQNTTVHLRLLNKLDIPTTLHSHGIRLDNAFDGVPELTQDEIAPGESFVYTIYFQDPGIFWYHPHLREDYTQELGLYGNFIVEPADAEYWSPVNREIPLVLDDILLRSDTIPPFKTDTISHALMGRYGTAMMINGSAEFKIDVVKGEVIRFLLTNVSSARPFRISFSGVRTKLVGTDIGTFAYERFVDNIVLAPADRMVVECFFVDTGLFAIENTGPDPAVKLGEIQVTDRGIPPSFASQFERLRTDSSLVSIFDSLRLFIDQPPSKRLVFSIEMDGMSKPDSAPHAEDEGIEWENNMIVMNTMSNGKIRTGE